MRSRSCLAGITAGIVLLQAIGLALADEAFDPSKKTYEEAAAKIVSNRAAGREQMLVTYARSLEKIMADLQAQGNLDAYLATQREKARFDQEKSVPPTPPPSLPPAVVTLQERFNTALVRMERDSQKEEAKLAEQYVDHLKKTVKRLVVEGKIDDAKSVDAELKRMEALLAAMPAAAPARKPVPPVTAKIPAPAPAPAPPLSRSETALKAVVRGYRGEAHLLDLEHGGRHVTRDARTGGYLFDGTGSCVPWDNDIPRKIGAGDFSIAFEFQPARQKNDPAYVLEHHRGFPWTGLFVAIENNRTLRFRVKDLPHNDIDCDIGSLIGDGKYHAMVLSRRGRDLEIYIDGKREAKEEQPEAADLNIDYAGNTLMVGTHCERQPNYFAGGLKNMAIFVGDALSQREVEQLAR